MFYNVLPIKRRNSGSMLLILQRCKCPAVTAIMKNKSEAIDTDQSVALMVTKVTIDTDRWQVRDGNVY